MDLVAGDRAGEGQGLVFHADVEVLQFDFGEVGLEDQFVLGLIDIDGRRPGTVGLGFVEEAGEGVLEVAKAGEGVVMGQRHGR